MKNQPKTGEIDTYTIGGTVYQRIRFGDEDGAPETGSAFCPDCGVERGQLHIPSCGVERCPACKGEAITCYCAYGQKNCA